MMKSYFFAIVIEKDADGYSAYCPALQGCYTQGENYEEAMENIMDAIQLHLEDRKAEHESILADRTRPTFAQELRRPGNGMLPLQ